MTYEVIVLDRGRAIARHRDLTRQEAVDLAAAYRALGWAEDRVVIERKETQAAA